MCKEVGVDESVRLVSSEAGTPVWGSALILLTPSTAELSAVGRVGFDSLTREPLRCPTVRLRLTSFYFAKRSSTELAERMMMMATGGGG